MPRKSRILRLEQAVQLSAAWNSSMYANDWRHRFIIDMIARLERNRGTSTKQRNWLDQLITDGVPAEDEKNPELCAQMKAAIAGFEKHAPAFDWEIDVIKDMLPRVAMGRPSSEKQTALLTRLIFEGEQCAAGNAWYPSPEMLVDLATACSLYHGYSPLWKSERPGLARARLAVIAHLEDGVYLKANSAQKVLKAVSSRMKTIKSPRFKTGDIGKLRLGGEYARVICMSDVRVSARGFAENDWLLPTGELKTLGAESVSKR